MADGLAPGTVVQGKYRIESVLGRGGMGVVHLATHLQLSEQLALKMLLPETASNPEVAARFLREARSVVRLRGEHVTRVSDVGALPDGGLYIAMEYLRGIDLAAELRRRKLSPGEVVDYILQACEALAEAHAHGIIHRDIKPSNLFVTARPDGTPLVKVLDFGISKASGGKADTLTRTDHVMGTLGYMSPEQMKASKNVDVRTDIWALGIVLYECLNGRRPFEADSSLAEALMTGTEQPPPMDPAIPLGLQATVLRCLEKDRAARFPSIAILCRALAPFALDRRTATVIVDRTQRMLRTPIIEPDALAPTSHPPTATTLPLRGRRARSPARRPISAARIALTVGMICTVSFLAGLFFLLAGEQRASTIAHQAALSTSTAPSTSRPTVVQVTLPALNEETDRRAAVVPSADPDVVQDFGRQRHNRRPPITLATPDQDASIAPQVKQAAALEKAGRWSEARAAYQKLEKMNGYSAAEAIYHQAWCAFQMNSIADTVRLAAEAARPQGPFKARAMLLYGDALYRQNEYARAKNIYLGTRKRVTGVEQSILIKKIEACNKQLKLPEADGIDD